MKDIKIVMDTGREIFRRTLVYYIKAVNKKNVRIIFQNKMDEVIRDVIVIEITCIHLSIGRYY